MTIKNGKNLSGVEVQVTGTAPSGFVLRDSSAVLQGALGLAVAGNDWATGSVANDVVVSATNRLLLSGGPNAGGGFALLNPQGAGNASTGISSTHSSGVDVFGATYCNVNVGAAGVVINSPGGLGKAFVTVIGGNADTTVNDTTFELQSHNWNPASGALRYRAINLNYAISQTGSASGAAHGIFLNATETAVLGTHTLMELQIGGTPQFIVDNKGGFQCASAALATGATTGVPRLRTMAGTPTGAVADGSFVIDTTGSKLWARVGGAWKGVVIA